MRPLDQFFFYGEPGSDVNKEIDTDVQFAVIQPKRSLYFNRQFGCDITKRENHPNTAILMLTTRYDIVSSIAFINTTYPDQQGSPKDRRVAVGQTNINFRSSGDGISLEVKYIKFSSARKANNINLPVGTN